MRLETDVLAAKRLSFASGFLLGSLPAAARPSGEDRKRSCWSAFLDGGVEGRVFIGKSSIVLKNEKVLTIHGVESFMTLIFLLSGNIV